MLWNCDTECVFGIFLRQCGPLACLLSIASGLIPLRVWEFPKWLLTGALVRFCLLSFTGGTTLLISRWGEFSVFHLWTADSEGISLDHSFSNSTVHRNHRIFWKLSWIIKSRESHFEPSDANATGLQTTLCIARSLRKIEHPCRRWVPCAFRTCRIYESHLSLGMSVARSNRVNVFGCNKLTWIYENPSRHHFLHDIYGSLLEFGWISSLLLNLIGKCCTFDFFSYVCCPCLPLHREIGGACQVRCSTLAF